MMLKINRAPLIYYIKLCASFQSHQWIQTRVTVQKCFIQVKIFDFFVLSWCYLEIWLMILKNNMAPPLCYFKLCASFCTHQWIQTGVTVQKHSIWVKIFDTLYRVTLKFYRWPWKTIRHLFNAFPSSVHHFITISEIKLELHSGNSQFGSKSMILCPIWPWNLMDDLKNIRASLLCHFKFVHHFVAISVFELELQSWNAQIGSKLAIFCPLWPWNLTDDLEKP